MEATDIKRQFAVDVVRTLHEAGYTALWAGGCVRDFLLGRIPNDYDVATDARPDAVRQLFGQRRTVPVGAAFGVILVRGPKGAGDVEVATFRTEGPYADGRRPVHVAFATAQEDARRRDFTINGMFYDPIAQRVLDYVGGEQDLSAGIVRAIGNPADRMREDKLRMLRAVRFAAGMEFQMDQATAQAVRGMAREILIVSAERIAQELRLMLTDRHRKRAVELCADLNLLEQILPEIAPLLAMSSGATASADWEQTLAALALLEKPSLELAAAVLLARVPVARPGERDPAVRAIAKRLRLSNDETDRIAWLVAHQGDLHAAPDLPTAALKRLLAREEIGELISLNRARLLAASADLHPVLFCEEYLRAHTPEEINPLPLLTGDDLVAQGWSPGPQFREVLDAVRDAQLSGEISTRAEAMALAARLRT